MTKQRKLRHKWIEIFKMDLWWIINPDKRVAERLVKKEFKFDWEIGDCSGRFLVLGEEDHPDVMIIWCAEERCIAHEVFHVVSSSMRNRGISLTDSSTEEVYAYMIEYVDWLIREELE